MSELTLRQRLDAYERLMRLDKPIDILVFTEFKNRNK